MTNSTTKNPTFSKTTRFALNVNNLLDKRHAQFIGAPILGRLIMTRLTQSLDEDTEGLQTPFGPLGFGMYANAAIPVGGFAKSHKLGVEFGGVGRIQTNNPSLMVSFGASYTTFPVKTDSLSGIFGNTKFESLFKSFNHLKVFLGPRVGKETGIYFLPAISGTFDDNFTRLGFDAGSGIVIPVGTGNTKYDLGAKFSLLNLIGKDEDNEENIYVLRLGAGVVF